MKNSDPRPTNAEAERIHRMMKLGCVCCALIGQPRSWVIECHHILEGHRRLGHWWTLPLCEGHHQGRWSAYQLQTIPDNERVAISDGRKRFNRAYGGELPLWQALQQRMDLDDTLPVSKCVPRKISPCTPTTAVTVCLRTDS